VLSTEVDDEFPWRLRYGRERLLAWVDWRRGTERREEEIDGWKEALGLSRELPSPPAGTPVGGASSVAFGGCSSLSSSSSSERRVLGEGEGSSLVGSRCRRGLSVISGGYVFRGINGCIDSGSVQGLCYSDLQGQTCIWKICHAEDSFWPLR